jgi:pimeloyl-ACP methyl ester carboxylesterase
MPSERSQPASAADMRLPPTPRPPNMTAAIHGRAPEAGRDREQLATSGRTSVPRLGTSERRIVEIMQLMLLHALPLDGTMWVNEMQLLPERTIAPTLYEFGESIEDWARAVLDLASEGPLVVVGNSVGGSCALEVARQAPDRVVAIVLIGAKAGVRPEPLLRDEAVRTLQGKGMAEAWPRYWAGLFGANADPEVVQGARRLACSLDVHDVVRGVKAFHNRPDLTDFTRRWPKPLVVVSGDQDGMPSHAAAADTASCPLDEVHLVENAGHYVSLE